jgi:hypothetical protein
MTAPKPTPTEREVMKEYDAKPTDRRATVYKPGHAMIGEATPQTNPPLFTDDEILAEVKHLIRMNKRLGPHVLRTLAYTRLMTVLAERQETREPKRMA